MLFDLSTNVKDKIINTLRMCFSSNPDHRNVHITDRFPHETKKMPAIVVKNASFPLERAGVDDYIKDIDTETGEVVVTHKRGDSFTTARRQNKHLLYCVQQTEIFKLEVIDENSIRIYRRRSGKRIGPIPVMPGTVIRDLIYDVEIEIGPKLVPGDFMTVLLVPIGGAVARLYGGLCEMEMTLSVYAEDTPEITDIADWAIMYLWHAKKAELEREQNILIKSVKNTGESESPELKDNIYMVGIDISLRSQWSWKVDVDDNLTGIDLMDLPEIETCDGIPLSVID